MIRYKKLLDADARYSMLNARCWWMFHWHDAVEFSFYFVETFALPFAILVFLIDRRRQRAVDREEIYQRLSDEYTNFLKLVLDNADLQLLRRASSIPELSEEQKERKLALFGILVSIFERAYILVYEDHMDKLTRRLWSSWVDYMREWCSRPDFRLSLPELLEGEDPDFRKHIEAIAREAASHPKRPTPSIEHGTKDGTDRTDGIDETDG